jgi:hypothetical protein
VSLHTLKLESRAINMASKINIKFVFTCVVHCTIYLNIEIPRSGEACERREDPLPT